MKRMDYNSKVGAQATKGNTTVEDVAMDGVDEKVATREGVCGSTKLGDETQNETGKVSEASTDDAGVKDEIEQLHRLIKKYGVSLGKEKISKLKDRLAVVGQKLHQVNIILSQRLEVRYPHPLEVAQPNPDTNPNPANVNVQLEEKELEKEQHARSPTSAVAEGTVVGALELKHNDEGLDSTAIIGAKLARMAPPALPSGRNEAETMEPPRKSALVSKRDRELATPFYRPPASISGDDNTRNQWNQLAPFLSTGEPTISSVDTDSEARVTMPSPNSPPE